VKTPIYPDVVDTLCILLCTWMNLETNKFVPELKNVLRKFGRALKQNRRKDISFA